MLVSRRATMGLPRPASCEFPVYRAGASELLSPDCFVAPASFRGEDQPDAAGVILVLGRGGGVQQISVFGDQQVAERPSKRGGFAAGEVEHLASVLGDALRVLLTVLITDLRVARHDDTG